MTFLSTGARNPFGPTLLEWNLPIECFSFSEDQSRFLSRLRMLCIYITEYYLALPTFHSRRAAFYRYLSHLRMTCREYRSVYVIRVSTRQILALRELCAYCVFDPRFVSCWPMFADLSVVRRRCAVFAKIVFSPTRNATSNTKHRHLSSDTLVSRSGAKTRQLSIICITSLPITSCYSCFL